ncbi:hypothetical protein E3N88_41619 [Mikania micrantha]|uniref:Protein kinase domain-containing protein n=1 Tax=Mikania micrantha TaxID=192012 RepID=A0A5N6LK76_9ASTR|nr:hypothetical protein E3N88_41619 [Mikania micrantha]
MVQTWGNSGNNIGSSSSDPVVATKLESLKADIAALKARDSYYHISDNQKVKIASMYLLGDVLDLYAWLSADESITLWEDLVQAYTKNFSPVEFQNPDEFLCSIKQTKTMQKYQQAFAKRSSQVSYWSLFLNRLKKDLSSSIIMAFATGKELAPSTSSAQPSVSCHHFEFPEILIATENFSESLVIGRGGFGKVYNSNIINGSNVVVAAIKHLDSMSNQGAADLWAEVEMLSMLWHCAGQGFHCLHTGTGIASGVMHRDVKSSNIQGDLKLSTNSKDINMLSHVKEVPAHFRSWVKENTLAPSKQGVGMAVAVKRLNKESTQGAAEWQAEVNFLGHMDHPNIIRLLGYCRDELEHLLVYEYMPNISFDRFLFSDTAEPLSWGTRLLIMIGVARGLTYLHLKNIIHRYLEPSTILLDENFNAKLGGFGLARYNSLKTGETYVTTPVTGTYGYAAPEYIATGHLTTKCDIYSFGVVLLVSITGQKAMDVHRPEGQQRLVEWATHIGSNIKKIMDPCLEGKYPRHGASEYVALALRCVAENPKHRPSAEQSWALERVGWNEDVKWEMS